MLPIQGNLDLQQFSHAVNTAQYDQILASFVTFCLPTQTSEEVPLVWLSSLVMEPVKSRTLLLSSASLGYGWIGHVENRADVLKKGRMFYSHALVQLRSTLSQPTPSPDLLPIILILLLYEVFLFNSFVSVISWKLTFGGRFLNTGRSLVPVGYLIPRE